MIVARSTEGATPAGLFLSASLLLAADALFWCSGLFYFTEEQRRLIEASRDAYQNVLAAKGKGRITTQIESAHNYPQAFYYAEDYHQQYGPPSPFGCAFTAVWSLLSTSVSQVPGKARRAAVLLGAAAADLPSAVLWLGAR